MSLKSQPKIEKPKLSRQRLRQHNVSFYEKVHDGDELPEWLSDVRGRLISVRRKQPVKRKKEIEKELGKFHDSGHDSGKAINEGWSLKPLDTDADSAYYDRVGRDPHARKVDKEFDKCAAIAKEARAYREKNEMEPRWAHFLQDYFFKNFETIYTEPNPSEKLLKRWEIKENIHWSEFPNDKNMNPEVPELTGPKPDFTYAFPIIDTLAKGVWGDHIHLEHDSEVRYFSRGVLSKLRRNADPKVKSAPTTHLQTTKDESQTLNANGSICFPWAVVEVKRNKVITAASLKHSSENKEMEQFCYCQAANASARALELREGLLKGVKFTKERRNIQVIFSLTCVGPSVKLWVTYRKNSGEVCNNYERILMKCIWATSLELTWGALQLRMVIKNMKEWVYEKAKPVIARQVERIYKNPQRSTNTRSWDSIQRASRAESCAPQTSKYDNPRPKTPPLHRLITEPESVDRGRSRIPAWIIPTVHLNGGEGGLSDESWDSDGTCVNQIEEAKVNRSRSISDTELRNLESSEETKQLMAIPGGILTRSRRRSQLFSEVEGEAEEEREEGNACHAEEQYQIPLRPKSTTVTASKPRYRSRDRSKTKSDGESEGESEQESSTPRRRSLRRRSSRF
ncbi:hypothetical protein BCR34DRAFT_184004 [Clohesyomyces aquaticus]|uniref:Uncharacterized protein n=1 Tax=Clohesyomyces aquaticus TaxID=1231657 RepID=A0A1Y1ZYK6_9PLEO|nr:hypothetical protein BCR34DRAFT_184004 [Clohesyomyces aquaticus]